MFNPLFCHAFNLPSSEVPEDFQCHDSTLLPFLFPLSGLCIRVGTQVQSGGGRDHSQSMLSVGDRGVEEEGIKGHDPTLPPARRASARQGTPARGGGGQGASRPTGVHLRFTRHSSTSRTPTSPSWSCGSSWSSQLSFACLQKTTS